MHKKKKIKTTIIEKFKYDNDDDYGITLAPELLLKLLEYAYTDASSDEELHAIVTRAHILSHGDDDDCLWMDDYPMLITNAIPVNGTTVETPTEPVATLPV